MATFKKDKRPPVDVNNVFIKFLPQDVSDDGLRQMFVSFGVISSCKVMIDQATGKSLGYGYV
jgi:polyadenylate-binding protein